MIWEKLGRIFDPTDRAPWMRSHSANPVAMPLGGGRFRIYCSGRDEQGRAQVGYFEIDMARPDEVLDFSATPFLGLGPLGAFDDAGVLNGSFVDLGTRQLHYFSGLTLARTVPFTFFASVAVSDDGGRTATKLSRAPLLGRNAVDPFLTGSPCVRYERGRWRMWYTSGVRWEHQIDSPRHYYHIKYAESQDGIDWWRDGHVCIDFSDSSEYVVARPWVVAQGDGYRMWYSKRGDAYGIGYAESADGLSWTRRDDLVGIGVSASGWDSEMICYASILEHGRDTFMLYNGNGYGRTGVGLARLVRA